MQCTNQQNCLTKSIAPTLSIILSVASEGLGQSFTGVVFAKGCQFRLVFRGGEGFGVGFRWVLGHRFAMENNGKGESGGEGRGWGRDRQRNRQVNGHAFVKTTL